jgi:hypothetical protein
VEKVTKYRFQEIAVALGELARDQMEPDLAMMVLDKLGLSLSDLAEAGADPYDLDALRESNSEKSLMRPSSRANSPRKYS